MQLPVLTLLVCSREQDLLPVQTHQSLSLSSPVISISPNQEPFLRPKSITPFPILWRLTWSLTLYKTPPSGVEERKTGFIEHFLCHRYLHFLLAFFLSSSFNKKKKGQKTSFYWLKNCKGVIYPWSWEFNQSVWSQSTSLPTTPLVILVSHTHNSWQNTSH